MSTVPAVKQLPPEIILEVISRLPAESVIQCKCVCRIWRSLLHLNNRHFARLHLHHQQQQQATGGSQFDFIQFSQYKTGIRGQDFKIIEYDHRVEDNDDQSKNISYRVRKLDHHVPVLTDNQDDPFFASHLFRDISLAKAIGSCNGLVCLAYVFDPTYICNPVTREYVNLPKHTEYLSRIRYTDPSAFLASGIGYHPCSHEYKVVRIYYETESSEADVAQVDVYTVGKDCGKWRKKGSILPNVKLIPITTGVSFNGTLYWPTRVSNPLLGFDLADEEFYVVQVPSTDYYGASQIGILGGCLSLTTQPLSDTDVIDVWVMEDCTRSKELWVKKFSMPACFGSNYCVPCGLTNEDEILLWYDYGDKRIGSGVFLGCYDPKTGKLRRALGEEEEVEKLNATSVHIWHTWRGIPHIKSFVSLKDLGEEDVKTIGSKERVKVKMSMKRKPARTTSSSTKKQLQCFSSI